MTAIEDARADLQEALDWIAPYQEAVNHVTLTLHRDQVVALLDATTPPTDDERKALARIVVTERIKARGLADLMAPKPHEIEEFGGPTADAILAAGFRRQGPITDAMIQRAREASAAQFGYYPTIEEATVILEAARDAS